MPTRRRLTDKERKAFLAETRYVDGEPFSTVKGLRIIANALIDNGDATLESCMEMLAACNSRLDKKTTITPCSFCAKKLGLQQCSGCSRTDSTRYCSRECQVAAWPLHKALCRSRQTPDVE